MSTPVWIWRGNYPGGAEINYEENQIDLGGGVVKTVQHEVAFTAYDLTGQSRSRKGTASFPVVLNNRDFTALEFVAIMRFLMARKEAGNESFYYYNPTENSDPGYDDSAEDTVGRYLVKHLGKLSWTINALLLHNVTRLVFTEDRS